MRIITNLLKKFKFKEDNKNNKINLYSKYDNRDCHTFNQIKDDMNRLRKIFDFKCAYDIELKYRK